MPRQLTSSELVRIYACLKACWVCGAKRGEPCVSRKGKKWKNSGHAGRCGFHDIKKGTPLHEAFQKLKAQILNQEEVVGHE